MKSLFICPRWGSESLAAAEFVNCVCDAGYDGIEVPVIDPELDAVVERARSAGLAVCIQHYDVITRDLGRHLELFASRLENAAARSPDFINSQSGRDCFSLEENLQIFDLAEQVSATAGISIYHETHRQRCFHTPWRTLEVLRLRPSLRITLDLSHWCAVCETLLEDLDDQMEEVVPFAAYIHARVGHAEGPQVSDPRAPEWKQAVDIHRKWWSRVLEARRAAGAESMPIAPEFGPAPYLPALPYTCQPVADQWAINVHMMELLRAEG